MRCIRRDDDNAAGLHFTGFIADRDGGAAFDCERDLDIWMRVQRRALAGLRADNVGRKWRALLFAHEFIRHSNKRQPIQIQKAHGESIARKNVKAECNLMVPPGRKGS